MLHTCQFDLEVVDPPNGVVSNEEEIEEIIFEVHATDHAKVKYDGSEILETTMVFLELKRPIIDPLSFTVNKDKDRISVSSLQPTRDCPEVVTLLAQVRDNVRRRVGWEQWFRRDMPQNESNPETLEEKVIRAVQEKDAGTIPKRRCVPSDARFKSFDDFISTPDRTEGSSSGPQGIFLTLQIDEKKSKRYCVKPKSCNTPKLKHVVELTMEPPRDASLALSCSRKGLLKIATLVPSATDFKNNWRLLFYAQIVLAVVMLCQEVVPRTDEKESKGIWLRTIDTLTQELAEKMILALRCDTS